MDRAKAVAGGFHVSSQTIRRGTDHFVRQLGSGLLSDGTALLQVPSYVTSLPNGTEKGSKAAIPADLVTAKTYRDLFGFIARHTEVFMQEHMPGPLDSWRCIVKDGQVTDELRRQRLHPLGFTFSFTFNQHAINKGTLMYWTKAFNINDAVGRDPCAMLQEALDELHLPLLVTALVNDTVGTLAARAYASPGRSETLLGAIFGTGTNGAYVEKMTNIKKLHSHPGFADPGKAESMALNTEWGGFDKELSVLPTTIYDEALDRASVNPGDQHYEKRISGLYLGELLRRVILAEMQSLTPCFSMSAPSDSRLHIPYSIDSSFLSMLVRDQSPTLERAREDISKVLSVSQPSVADAAALQVIAGAIGERAARLSAIAIAGIVVQSGRLSSTPLLKGPSLRMMTTRPSFLARLWSACRMALGTVMGCIHHFFHTEKVKSDSTSQEVSSDLSYSSEEGKWDVSSEVDMIDIGVDGSLFEFFPGFEDHVRTALREIPAIGPLGEQRIQMGTAPDGSGVGAALIAWASKKT
ncbi:uncharacterized protein J7T54_002718 [Emericellopsis cladophorae]|uniref:Phosphotransferase n=1 Tax=Emericellopsis cladophorae TaxID=2686198 RepID=A0A9P9XUT7_9HYPO|nr:uncharacterized protein J7T54_002718 [Emericellopsis cladophorae]KAI6778183.1 hypothetical protein J7T54_002718 [Emericellopsis cladophorae]